MSCISAGLPNKWGTITTRVFLVSTAATVSALIFSSSPTSASTGVAPSDRIGGTTALQQNVGITISAPGCTPQASSASSNAKLPEPQRSTLRTPSVARIRDRRRSSPAPSITWPEKIARAIARYVLWFQVDAARGTRGTPSGFLLCRAGEDEEAAPDVIRG